MILMTGFRGLHVAVYLPVLDVQGTVLVVVSSCCTVQAMLHSALHAYSYACWSLSLDFLFIVYFELEIHV